MKKQKNPCIDVCDFSTCKGWCLGCGRTREECKKWKVLKPYNLNILKKELPNRLSQIKKGQGK
ncbi:DUF1289 domain-containing protein [Vibrio hibernica]|uniref:DUF1289 domain-containing protein n=1 Tax=Vibrio hibernica TaxID=2587465 RepID=UPI001882D966|nr:DUF1289 domain-containing protein [Vibrio hibernica]